METHLGEDSVALAGGLAAPAVDEPRVSVAFIEGGWWVVDKWGAPLRVFHGTNQPIASFDAARRGSATGTVSAAKADFFTDCPIVASDYAQYAGQRMVADIAAHERKSAEYVRQMEQAERRRDWALVERLTHEFEQHEISALRQGEQGSSVIPAYLSMRNPEIVDFAGGTPSTGEIADIIDLARASGRDGVIMLRIVDAPSVRKESTQFVVFHPEQIKSAVGKFRQFNLHAPQIDA